MRPRILTVLAAGAVIALAGCNGHNGGGNASGSGQPSAGQAGSSHAAASKAATSPTPAAHLAADSHSKIARIVVRDCEATVVSLARGTGAATPASYQSTVDHLAAELTDVSERDANSQEASALQAEAAYLTKYAADIAALPNAEYQHSTAIFSKQPLKGDMKRTIAEGNTLKQQYGIVCISP